jgi:uncharacterized protein with NRDE domain
LRLFWILHDIVPSFQHSITRGALIMCLILLAVDAHPSFKLVLAANRDEFYRRPSAPPAFWEEAPQLLAGRDLTRGGTWLGITRHGRIAAVTNYRDPSNEKSDAPSRGRLVRDFLLGKDSPSDYLDALNRELSRYNGFNLFVGQKDRLLWTSNRNDQKVLLPPGIHGVSNSLLNTPWPKIVRGKEQFTQALKNPSVPPSEALFKLLQDRHQPPDEELPSTGVPVEWERVLSPIFIKSPNYGTRSSTLIFIDRKDHVTFLDRTFHPGSERYETREFEFHLEA